MSLLRGRGTSYPLYTNGFFHSDNNSKDEIVHFYFKCPNYANLYTVRLFLPIHTVTALMKYRIFAAFHLTLWHFIHFKGQSLKENCTRWTMPYFYLNLFLIWTSQSHWLSSFRMYMRPRSNTL